MANNKSAVPAQLKPFQKGDDPRRHKGGSASAARQAWTIRFHNALVEKLTADQAADTLVAAFKAKQPWAVAEVLERIIGKVSQPVEGPDGTAIRIEVIHVGKDGGNGNGNGGEKK